MPNNTGEFAARVAALHAAPRAAQVRLANVAKQQNGLLESLARNELEQQKERIGTYQIQARFALAAIYDRAALGGGAAKRRDRRRVTGRARERIAGSAASTPRRARASAAAAASAPPSSVADPAQAFRGAAR